MAGESAREVARRRRESERLARRFERWERGAEVEERTAEALAALPPGWVVLHEVAWPGGGTRTSTTWSSGPAACS